MHFLCIKEWMTGSKHCWTHDQDVLRKCEPVNCIYKYGGLRNYFDENDQLCKKTMSCFSDPGSLLPKQVGIEVSVIPFASKVINPYQGLIVQRAKKTLSFSVIMIFVDLG